MNQDDTLSRAFALWEKNKNRGAFRLFLREAHGGNSTAQHNVGFCFDVGRGTKRNFRQAIFWYKRAWRGDRQTSTCSNIARLYSEEGLHRNARRWWEKAVNLGDGDAALDYAKYLVTRRRVSADRIRDLLRSVIKSKNVTEAARVEARERLNIPAK